MRVWLTDGDRGGFVLEGDTGRALPAECSAEYAYCPCATHELLLCACRAQRDVLCVSRRTLAQAARLPALPAMCAMCPSPCGRYLYQLSGEADALHTRSLQTGELRYGCRFGVFPRDLRCRGRLLLASGGASGEAALFSAPELRLLARALLPGAVCAADFWRDGLVIVCAVEEGDIRTVVYTAASLAATPAELMRFDGPPGGLCVCPDGVTAIFGALDGACRLSLITGRALWNLPQYPLCGRVCCRGDAALLSDCVNGRVGLVPCDRPWAARTVYRGSDAQACFL